MATHDNRLDRANIYVNGNRLLGQVTEYTLPEPELTYKTGASVGDAVEQHIGLNFLKAMTAELSLRSVNPEVLKYLGAEGNVVVRARIQKKDGSSYGMEATITGDFAPKVNSFSPDGEDSGMTLSVMVNYYKLVMNGATIHELGGPEQKLVINGVDKNPGTFV